MNGRSAWASAGSCLAVVVLPGLTAPGDAAAAATPDSCVEVNGGDWNACNVGNRGPGDLVDLPVEAPAHSVTGCIQVNQGDAPACRVGSVDGYYRR
jgi:hypothetical protein